MTLIRDAKQISSQLYTKGEKIYCKQKTIIEFPKWYEDKELASIQEVAYIYGIFAIIIGDKYSVSVIPTLIPTIPILVNEIEREEVIYTQFVYGKDDCIIENINVVKHDILSYNFFETYFMYAREPWYVEYEDLIKIMDNLVPYAKSNVGDSHISSELVVSYITRSKGNRKQFYRQVEGKSKYEYVDLMNVYSSVFSTTNRLAGGYFTNGMVSSLVQPSKTVSKIETLVI